MNESKNVRKNVGMMLTGMVIGAALTGGSIAVAAGITAEPTWQPIFVDGQQVEMQAYNIAGHNYVKLRDEGRRHGHLSDRPDLGRSDARHRSHR